MADIIIKNGFIALPERMARLDVRISGHRIERIAAAIEPGASDEVLDCTGKLVFPGIIDPHTHMGIPIKSGRSRDDFYTGSLSAVNGGVTTILDFSVLEPGQSLADSIQARKEAAVPSHIDVGLHGNITRFSPDLLSEIPGLVEQGIISFKVFSTYREAGMMLTYEQIEQVAQVIAANHGILMVHAEDDEVIQANSAALIDQRQTDPVYHGIARPPEAEAVAVDKLGAISERTGCQIYIVHLNSSEGLLAALKYPNLLIETCPHYLLFDKTLYQRNLGRMYVASPPLRTQADNQDLWNALIAGQIHTIGSDHCPFCIADKQEGVLFQDIPNGMGGVETSFPVMLARFLEQKQDLSLLARIQAENPARIFGLFPRKGVIQTGSDADIVIADPEKVTDGWQDRLVSVTDWNGYSGLPALFPDHVMLRGDWIVKDGQVIRKNAGEFVPGSIR